MSDTTPRVTISLVTWNGMRWLPACLDSVRAQTLADWELRVVDNASTDGSAEWLAAQAADDPRMHVDALDRNIGYAVAQNRTIRASRAEALLLLNQDVVLGTGFLAAAWEALDGDAGIGSVQGWIGRMGPEGQRSDIVDTTGLVMHRDRRVVSRDQLREAGPGQRPAGEAWGVDGPAPLYRHCALLDARMPRRGGGWEVLDEDFFSEKEDADLAWRLRRLGWRCRYEPAATAWHARTGGDTARGDRTGEISANMANPPDARIRAWRNQRLMQLKNDEPAMVLLDLPWIARRELAQLAFMMAADRRRLRAIPELLRLAPMATRKRRALARARRRSTT